MTHERDELQRRLTEIEADLRGQSQEISLKYNSVQGQVSEASLPPLLFFHAHYPHSRTHQLDETQSQLIRHKEEVAHLQSQLEQQKISHQQQMLALQSVTHTHIHIHTQTCTHTHAHTHTHTHMHTHTHTHTRTHTHTLTHTTNQRAYVQCRWVIFLYCIVYIANCNIHVHTCV